MPGVLYDSGYNSATQARTRIVRDAETGVPLIIREHDSRPILNANKRQAASFTNSDAARPVVHVARIPRAVYARLVRTGVARDPAAFNRWLNDRDNRVFRVDDARTL